ncbi:hypothetical protein D9Q98_000593 [Chlorella vulgaris]|uniref:Uncharacterized protein n=1 Tax=Chlorella vulgaris TaxID=3077 RepID=A0A9D4TYE1_CHLVU|nr:hypothetical protein D9Q98_000593 [Chlorella vulgaris]
MCYVVPREVVPASLADNLTRLIAEGTGEEDEGADRGLRAGAVEAYLELLDRPKLPHVLLKVICWVVGEYGCLSALSTASVMDKLAAVPETKAPRMSNTAAPLLDPMAALAGLGGMQQQQRQQQQRQQQQQQQPGLVALADLMGNGAAVAAGPTCSSKQVRSCGGAGLGFGDFLADTAPRQQPSQQQQPAAPLMGGPSKAPPAAKKDPFADLLG